jgi:hypothetical protein
VQVNPKNQREGKRKTLLDTVECILDIFQFFFDSFGQFYLCGNFSSHNMTNLQWHFPSFIIIISLFSIPIQHTHSLSLKAETTRRTWFQKSFLPSSAVAIFRSTSSSTFLVLGPVVPGVVGGVVRPQVSFAAETVGKDPDCNDASCLGVWDGLLADCPHYDKIAMYSGSAGCASSQDDTPGVFAEP